CGLPRDPAWWKRNGADIIDCVSVAVSHGPGSAGSSRVQSGPFIERERRGFVCFVLIVAALHCAVPAHATITSLGNVNPAPATSTGSTHLLIGNTATGTMIVNGGSDVVALSSTLGQAPGALGVAQITG